MSRFIAFLFGIVGALGSSQAPGFTLQYVQNLTGRVDELRVMVRQIDADIADFGLTREETFAACAEEDDGSIAGALCLNSKDAIQRYEILNFQLAELNEASEWQKPILIARSRDNATFESTLEAFQPAVPATVAGGGYAIAGFALLWGIASLILGILTAPFRRY